MLGHVPFVVVYIFSKQKKKTAQLTLKEEEAESGEEKREKTE